MKQNEPIALIGLGLLGSALATRLLQGGFSLFGFDPSTEAVEQFRELGGTPAESAAAAAKQARTVILSLPNSSIVETVIAEILDLAPGQRWIVDTTTGTPEISATLAERLGKLGMHYLDLTIAGSSRELLAGQVVGMIGGSNEDLAELQPMLATFARQSFALGKAGDAARMKLVTNMALGLHRAVLAETLVFADSQGFPAELAIEVLKSTSSYSRVMDIKGHKMVNGDFTPDARLRQHLKDVKLMREEGQAAGLELPLTRLHDELLSQAVEEGWGDLDNSAVLRVLQKRRVAQ